MKIRLLLVVTFLLAGCTVSSPPPQGSSSSSTATSSIEGAGQPIAAADALDRTFSSQKLGIELKYPSTFYEPFCNEDTPVTAREVDGAVEFVQRDVWIGDCTRVSEGRGSGENHVIATVQARRVSSEADVQRFVDTLFPDEHCAIGEQSQDGDTTRIGLRLTTPPYKDEPDFRCGETLLWNKRAGVLYQSALGSKDGGGYKWPSWRPILMPDGSLEGGYDYPIMQSITVVE